MENRMEITERHMEISDNGFPRRIRIDLLHPVEKSILKAIEDVELLGADTLLTDAVCLLLKAKDKVSDFYEIAVTP